jgi:glycosyltransferase involved in cell wall biosynthesis
VLQKDWGAEVRVKWYLSDLHACGYVRGIVVAREVNRGWAGWHVDCKTEVVESDVGGTDLMVFQRQMSDGALMAMRRARERGVVCVYELDDDLWAVPEVFPGAPVGDPAVQARIGALVTEADAVTVSTMALGQRVANEFGARTVHVLRNALDAERWEVAEARRAMRVARDDGRGAVTIGYMASRSHLLDVGLVLGAVERVMRLDGRVRLHAIGWIGEKELTPGLREMGERVKCEGWVGVESLPEAMEDFDVGLAPLTESAYNRGKSGVKALQYWALGVPVVASRMPMYTELVADGEDGVLVGGGEEEGWFEALAELVENRQKRMAMGAAGRVKVLTGWDVRRRAGDWVRCWERIVRESRRV